MHPSKDFSALFWEKQPWNLQDLCLTRRTGSFFHHLNTLGYFILRLEHVHSLCHKDTNSSCLEIISLFAITCVLSLDVATMHLMSYKKSRVSTVWEVRVCQNGRSSVSCCLFTLLCFDSCRTKEMGRAQCKWDPSLPASMSWAGDCILHLGFLRKSPTQGPRWAALLWHREKHISWGWPNVRNFLFSGNKKLNETKANR